MFISNEHSSTAHTNGAKSVPRCGALSSFLKDAALQGGLIVVLRPLFAAALVVSRRYMIIVPKSFPVTPLVVRRRYLVMVPRPMSAATRSYLIVVHRPFPAAPLVERRRYLIMVLRPMPAAVASQCCRRRFHQLACACGS